MTVSSAPHSNVDLWDPGVMRDPYGTYRELRDMGGAVYLDDFDMWALARYEQVREVLGNYERFTSTQGTAMSRQLNEMVIGTILSEDPPMHEQMRSVLAEQLSRKAIITLTEDIGGRAEAMADELVAKGEFDAVKDFGEPLVIGIVAHLIGLNEDDWEPLLDLANSIFTVYGPYNAHTEANLPGAMAFYEYCATQAARERLRPGSWGAAIYEAADAGVIPQEQCTNLMASYIGAGMDTTIAVIAAALYQFSEHPDQYDEVRAEPAKLKNALNEVLRLEGPVQSFSRVTLEDYDADGVEVPAGSRMVVLYGSANRDERKWEDPDSFDIARNPVGHLGFGYGLHACAGQQLARLETESAVGAILKRVQRIEAGEPEIRQNNIVRGMDRLPLKVHV